MIKLENTFNEIAQQYYDAIFKYCCVRLNNEHAAKDCTQEVFLILYKKMDKLKLSENIRAWLYRTSDNVIKNYRRKNKDSIPLDTLYTKRKNYWRNPNEIRRLFFDIILKCTIKTHHE